MLLLRQQLEFPGWCWWDGHYRPSGLATRLLKTRTTVLLPGTPSSLAPWNDAHAPKLGRGYRSSSDNFRTPISLTRYPIVLSADGTIRAGAGVGILRRKISSLDFLTARPPSSPIAVTFPRRRQ